MEIHHIGYLVKKIDKAIASFEELGFSVLIPSTWDKGRNAMICFLTNNCYCVELICPTKESAIYPLLKQHYNSPYHLCYKCDNIEETIYQLKKKKFKVVRDPEPAPAIGVKARVAFLISANIGIIELVDRI